MISARLSVIGRQLSAVFAAALLLTGCAGVALTAAGIGGGAAASHHMGGIVFRTFSEPQPKVRKAVLEALRRMAIKVEGTDKIEMGERIRARAGDRTIEVEIEALTPNTTRVRAVAKKEGGIFVDSATAVEIINQTERVLGRG